MGEDPNGRLPGDADEPREQLQRPLTMRLREAANSVALFVEYAEDSTFNADDRAQRQMFAASLQFLEATTEAARRVFVAQIRGHHRRQARRMEVEDRIADASTYGYLPL